MENLGPITTHLFFEDDSLLFMKATEEAAGKIKEVLHWYETTSGQQTNLQKSSILFEEGT